MCKYNKNHIAGGESFEYINVCTQSIPEFEVQRFKLYRHLRSRITKPPSKVRNQKTISTDTSIFATSRTRHVFGVFNVIDLPIKIAYFRNLF